MAPTFLPQGREADALTFVSVDALAVHLLQQRPGRKLELLAQQCSRNGEPEFPVVAVFTTHADGRDFWLGWACGERAADLGELTAALARMRSAGGLAA